MMQADFSAAEDENVYGGCIFSDEPSDLETFGSVQEIPDDSLPPMVDLRQLMTPIEQQEQINSCVGNALAGAYEFLIMKNSRKHVDVSRLFIYYNSRALDCKETGRDPRHMVDRGTTIRNAIEALKTHGCCKERTHEYRAALVNQKPRSECYDEARNYRVLSAVTLNPNLNEMKACLAEGYPFAFGFRIYPSFYPAKTNGGFVPTPTQDELRYPAKEGHAMLAVGYSDATKCFIVRNSHGSDWGDKGYCYISYDCMTNPKLCKDLHAVREISAASRHPTNRQNKDLRPVIDNTYHWNVDKDKHYFIPQNYTKDYFDREFFWHYDDYDMFDDFHRSFEQHHKSFHMQHMKQMQRMQQSLHMSSYHFGRQFSDDFYD